MSTCSRHQEADPECNTAMRCIKDKFNCPSCGTHIEREIGVFTDQTLRNEIAKLRATLERIVAWEMPPSGCAWDDGTPMSYGDAFGSNGQRDLVRSWAAEALKL